MHARGTYIEYDRFEVWRAHAREGRRKRREAVIMTQTDEIMLILTPPSLGISADTG
jgi:hypothetical protein